MSRSTLGPQVPSRVAHVCPTQATRMPGFIQISVCRPSACRLRVTSDTMGTRHLVSTATSNRALLCHMVCAAAIGKMGCISIGSSGETNSQPCTASISVCIYIYMAYHAAGHHWPSNSLMASARLAEPLCMACSTHMLYEQSLQCRAPHPTLFNINTECLRGSGRRIMTCARPPSCTVAAQ